MLTDPGIVPITIEAECKNKHNKKFCDNEDSFTDSEDDNLIKKLQYVVGMFFLFIFTIFRVKIGQFVQNVNLLDHHVRIIVEFVIVVFVKWTIIVILNKILA